ncbi:MAG: hypothetical protein Q8Q80_06335 [Methyloversatilis sp.]|uniref:hypothetical protein n=1 Tax=Methyloversatilis sp. TaxID=2569862 RepID=UPI002736BF9B|nr:hypothetical protein [Methyloversatilis sp.]MDP3872263.1 hypothetical protein [Methyloversatilis sp.]
MSTSNRLFTFNYNLLFRWGIGVAMDDVVCDCSVFSINRDRPLDDDIARPVFRRVLPLGPVAGLRVRSDLSVDGTMIEAWASF